MIALWRVLCWNYFYCCMTRCSQNPRSWNICDSNYSCDYSQPWVSSRPHRSPWLVEDHLTDILTPRWLACSHCRHCCSCGCIWRRSVVPCCCCLIPGGVTPHCSWCSDCSHWPGWWQWWWSEQWAMSGDSVTCVARQHWAAMIISPTLTPHIYWQLTHTDTDLTSLLHSLLPPSWLNTSTTYRDHIYRKIMQLRASQQSGLYTQIQSNLRSNKGSSRDGLRCVAQVLTGPRPTTCKCKGLR